jgi:3-phenylpropionate/trans-cinnamate dioxygenase ferredoxin reductase subunit
MDARVDPALEAPSSIVVVGGGLAGAKAVEALRENGFEGSLTLVGAEPHLPYERPALSKDYLQGKADRTSFEVHDRAWYDDHDVTLVLGQEATALDLAAGTVTAGGASLPFDRLLLATGAAPRRLDLPGAALDGVLALRTVDDSDRLRAALRPGTRLVVVGGGWIGLETAAAAVAAGAVVTVLESAELPLLRVLGREMAGVSADLHREKGVDLRTGVQVRALRGERSVTGVELDGGEVVDADVVLVGVGAAPSTALAEAAGLAVEDGVLVDAQGRSSDPRVFAVGDVANAEHPVLGRRVRVEHWANALNQPAVVATAMLGGDARYDRQPYFYSDQYDLGMEYTGLADPEHDRLVVRGDVAGRELVAFWTRDGAVVAGMNVNVWDVTDDIKALIASGRAVDPGRLADPSVPLADLLT